jgi:aquaporin Z
MKKYAMELLGTFLFVLTISLIVSNGSAYIALGIGLALAILVYVGSHISGSHFNPAVTLAVYLRGVIGGYDAIMYVLAQLIGGVLAIALGTALTGDLLVVAPGADASLRSALVVEIIFTFVLALTVLHVATTDEQSGNSYFGLAIGGAVTIGIIAGGAISGGAFNPAVGFASNIMQ